MKKILFIVVLIFSILTTTETAFAYFDKESTPVFNSDERLYVLNPQLITQNKYLVPEGSVLGMNDTYYYTYKYEVIVEKGVTLDSSISDITWNNSNLSNDELTQVFNYDISYNYIKDVNISNGLFQETTDGELIEITVLVSMNDLALFYNNELNLGDELSFSYIFTASNNKY